MADFKDLTRPREEALAAVPPEDQELYKGILSVLPCLQDSSLSRLVEAIRRAQVERESEKIEAFAATAGGRRRG